MRASLVLSGGVVGAEAIRERIRTAPRSELIGIAALGLVLLAGMAFWYVRSLPHPVEVTTSRPGGRQESGPVAAPSPTEPLPAAPSPSPLIVHVAGWVMHPGVYELWTGDRVIDAIQAAGGAKPGADLRHINLAALLVDSQQIIVAKGIGGGISSTSEGGPAPGGTSPAGGEEDQVNLNTEVLAQRIMDYREENGPFASVDDLLEVSGIGDTRLEDLRPHITV
jgi:competence protein ComEA